MKATTFILFIFLQFAGRDTNTRDTIEKISHNNIIQKLDIYLLIGQSNMAGRAEIEEQDLDTIKNVYLFSGIPGNEWEGAVNPLNKYSTVRKELSMQKLGPGYTFAQKISKTFNTQVGLVVNARGGTSIDEWMPNAKLYNEAIKRTKKAMNYGNIRGILWHQGSSDVKNMEPYLEKIEIIIQSFRSDLNAPNLPFIAGELSESSPERRVFNKMMKKLPKSTKMTRIVSIEGLTTHDGSHFDTQSQRKLGERYADEIINIIRR